MRSRAYFKKRQFIVILAVLLALIVSACGGDGDDGDPTPTSNFPLATKDATPTPLPGFSETEVGGLPTIRPTATRFTGFPTLAVAPTIPPRYPNNIQIVSPVQGGILSGNLTVFGSASHPDFVQYALEYGPNTDGNNLWYPITVQSVTVPVLSNALGAWNTTLVPDGTYQIRLHVYLTGGREVTNVVVRNLTVQNAQVPTPIAQDNQPPTISPIAPLNLQRGTTATIALGIYDPDGDVTTYIATSDNTAVASVTPTGQSAITVSANGAGVSTLRIRVTDNRGGNAETSFLVTVTDPQQQNNPPSIVPIASQTISQNASVTLPVSTSDPDGNPVTITVSSANVSIATATKLSEQSINVSGVGPGTATVTITASDGSLTTTYAFAVVVTPAQQQNNPPTIAPVAAQTIEVGQQRDIFLSISDPDGNSTDFSFTVSAGAVSATKINVNTLRITGVSTGTANITITATDSPPNGQSMSVSTVFGVTVTNPPPQNQNPTIGTIQNQTVDAGDTINIDLMMSDPDGDSLTFSSSSNATNVATTGQVDADTLSVTGVSAGTATITVNVGDGNGGTASTSFSVTVNPATVPNQDPVLDPFTPLTIEVGQTVPVPINWSDPDGDQVTVSPPPSSDDTNVATVFESNFELSITGVAQGSAAIEVTIDDGRGGSATQSLLVTVTASNQNPTIAAVSDQTCDAGTTVDVTISYSDPDGDQVMVTPSSNNPSVASAAVNITTMTVTCSTTGNATITLDVADGQGGTASVAFNVNVGSSNQNPTLADIAPQACQGGTTLDVSLSYSDPDGDTVTVSASSDNPAIVTTNPIAGTTLTLNCVAEGGATVSVTADDGNGGSVTKSFPVSVSAAPPSNQNPSIIGLDTQNCEAGTALNVTLGFSDPDGDTVTVTAASDSPGIADGSVAGNALTIDCVAEGSANMTLTADDGNGGQASVSFAVMVSAPAPTNQDPTIGGVGGQACEAGSGVPVTISYSDPDGDTVTVTAASDAPGVASATVAGTTVSVTCSTEGTANITLTADDGNGGQATTSFGVTVSAPPPQNQDPTINDVAPQTCEAGTALPVAISFSDPDGDTVTVTAASDNSPIATGAVAGNTVNVTCSAEGFANITLTADDGNGGQATTSFGVTVSAPPPTNQDPTIDAIGPQTCDAGTTVQVAVNASDPDGDTVTLTSASDNGAVASVVEPITGSPITVDCTAEGLANITLTADDGNGGQASTMFPVTVNAAAPPFDVTVYPELPDVGALSSQLEPVYNDGVTNQGRVNTAFSIAGDTSLTAPNFMDPIAVDNYNLGNYAGLQASVDHYNFGFQSLAVGTNWNPDNLLDPASADPSCQPGETPLACEIRVTNPVVIIISFAPSNAAAMPLANFQTTMEQIVDVALNSGVIPVLVTFPDDGLVDANTLAQYNEALVNVATNHTGHPDTDVPLWNLYNTMQGATSGVYNAGGSSPADYTDPSLVFGVNRRGLAALQILDRIRTTFFP